MGEAATAKDLWSLQQQKREGGHWSLRGAQAFQPPELREKIMVGEAHGFQASVWELQSLA